jgi:hypothetical protein
MMIPRLSAAALTVLLLSRALVSSHAQVIRINAGSNDDYVDADGNVWEADSSKFRPSDAPNSMAWKTRSEENIRNTQDDALYETERFGRGDNLQYSIPVPKRGDYEVRLFFSENFQQVQGPDKRKFHIVIEGKLEKANVDIYELARNEGFRATSQAFRTVVTGDTLDLELIKVKQNVSFCRFVIVVLWIWFLMLTSYFLLYCTNLQPKVNAIEIQKLPSDSEKIPIHPDITAILDVAKGDEIPLGLPWADSYSIGDRCYCMTTYDHNIDIVQVETAAGWMTVRKACEIIGTGPGYKEGYPIYNTIQCGHGPLNNAGDEHVCPGTNRELVPLAIFLLCCAQKIYRFASSCYPTGRVDFGFDGCGHIGPKWKFDEEKE